MNKQQFIEFLRKPSSLDDKGMREMEDLLGNYPYFQCGHALLAKACKIHHTKDANKKVASAAIYSADRILLKKFITGDLILLNPLKGKESNVSPAPTAKPVEALTKGPQKAAPPGVNSPVTSDKSDKKEAVGPAIKAPMIPTEKKADSPAPTQRTAPASEKPAPSPPLSRPKEESSTLPRSKAPTIQDIDDKEKLSQLAPSSSSLDQLIEELKSDMENLRKSKSKYLEVTKQIEEEDAVKEAVRRVTSEIISEFQKEQIKSPAAKKAQPEVTSKKEPETTQSTNEDSSEKKGEQEKPEQKETSAKSTVGDLKERADKEKDPTTPPAKTPAKKKSGEKKTRPKTTSTKTSAAKKTTTPKEIEKGSSTEPASKPASKKKEDQIEIVDNFIKNNPSFSPRQDKDDPRDLSHDSLSFHEDLASEHLAEIYLKQGRKERALNIYNKLVVKFPEKSAYFAGIIKNLKGE